MERLLEPNKERPLWYKDNNYAEEVADLVINDRGQVLVVDVRRHREPNLHSISGGFVNGNDVKVWGDGSTATRESLEELNRKINKNRLLSLGAWECTSDPRKEKDRRVMTHAFLAVEFNEDLDLQVDNSEIGSVKLTPLDLKYLEGDFYADHKKTIQKAIKALEERTGLKLDENGYLKAEIPSDFTFEQIIDKFANKWENVGPKTLERIWEKAGRNIDLVGLEVAKLELLTDELLRTKKPLEEFLGNFEKYSPLLNCLTDGLQSPFGRFVRSEIPLLGLYTRTESSTLSTQDYTSLFDKAVLRTAENLANVELPSGPIKDGFVISVLLLDVAKAGSSQDRKSWKGINPYIHNVAGAELIRESGILEKVTKNKLLADFFAKMVEYHGYIGQFSRGEVTESVFMGVTDWLSENSKELEETLAVLEIPQDFATFASEIYYQINVLDTKSVRDGLFTKKLEGEFASFREKMEKVLKGEANWSILEKVKDVDKKRELLADRLTWLRGGKDSEEVLGTLLELDDEKINYIFDLFSHAQLWYVENATANLSVENQIKLLTLVARLAKQKGVDNYGNFDVNFGSLMNTIRPHKNLDRALSRVIDTSLYKMSWDEVIKSPNEKKFELGKHLSINITGDNGITGVNCVLDKEMLSACNLINFYYEGKREKSSEFVEAVNILSGWTGIKLDEWDRVFDQRVYEVNMNVKKDRKTKGIIEGIENIKTDGRNLTYIGVGAATADIERDLAMTLHNGDVVLAIDVSRAMYESAKRNARVVRAERYLHPENDYAEMRVLLLDATNMESGDLGVDFEKTNVLFGFQSVFHELPDSIRDVIFNNVLRMLKVGDGITVRDFMRSEKPDEKNFLVLGVASEDEFDPANFIIEKFNKEFEHFTDSQQIEIGSWKNLKPGSRIEISNALAMELMGHYSWMKDGGSLNEIVEQYGHFSPSRFVKWVNETAKRLGIEVEIIKHIEAGEYEKYLKGKMELQDAQGRPLPVPLWMGIFNIRRTK